MQQLKDLQLDRPQPNETGLSLSKASATQLPTSSVKALAVLMSQTANYFAHQPIAKETAKVWMARWAELTQTFGLEVFQAGLSKAVHSSEFFPLPVKVEKACEEVKADIRREAYRLKVAAEEAERDREYAEILRSKREEPEKWTNMAEIYRDYKADPKAN